MEACLPPFPLRGAGTEGFHAMPPASGRPLPPLPALGHLSEAAALHPATTAEDGIYRPRRPSPSATGMLRPRVAPERAVREDVPYSQRLRTRATPAPAADAALWPAPRAALYRWRERRMGRPSPCDSRQDSSVRVQRGSMPDSAASGSPARRIWFRITR